MTLSREEILHLLDQMIEHQQKKVLEIARRFVPGITPEDARNPEDFEELKASHIFNFEDGILSGYISAKTALVAEMRMKED
ncbi:MAG: hypothetical protein P9L94_05070 [Candidatus Hinthialibacter antarcticus]|nr:hypothetical protein [Candidatus Hinthialibacter antarcticus]